MGRRRRRKPSPVSNSFVVAAVNSRDRWSADYVCDGVADEVDINTALAALGPGEGMVVLLEGDFTLAASIAFTAGHQSLQGQGRATRIDGTALPAGAHAIVLSGFTDCIIRDIAIEGLAGGGDTTHCIFIEDGADDFHVIDVTIINSDSDGIHIEGTTIAGGHIHRCRVEAADVEGIFIDMDDLNFIYRLHIEDCDIGNCPSGGIAFDPCAGNNYCQIINNVIYGSQGGAIVVRNGDYSMIRGNVVTDSSGADEIWVLDSNHVQILGNTCLGTPGFGHGINAYNCTYVTISGNKCLENPFSGISVLDSSRCIVAGNECTSNLQWGIIVDGASDFNKVSNNYTEGNTSGSIRVDDATCNNNQVEFNTVEEGDVSNVGTQTRAYGNYDPSADTIFVPIGANPW